MGVIDFYREKKDTTPVQGSKNGITSGAVYDALQLIKQFDYTTVAQLPTASADTMYRVYFVPSSNPGQQDTYDEYITTENDSVYSWERIGNSSIDISGKADKVTGATNGHIAGLNASGNLTDLGLSIVQMTQAAYNALQQKDANTLYVTKQISSNAPSGVSILYTDGTYSNYDTLDSQKTPVGVALNNEHVQIVLHPTEFSATTWGNSTANSTLVSGVTTVTTVADAAADYAGNSNTNAIISVCGTGGAINTATTATYADGKTGYLPSKGESNELFSNKTNINIALALIGGTNYDPDYNSNAYWTSTQYSDSYAWYLTANTGGRTNLMKNERRKVRSVAQLSTITTVKIYLGSTLIADSNNTSNIVKPIELTGLPSDSTDTVEKLNALGLTQTEILAASQGKRTGVVYNNIFYTIQAVNYISETSYTMMFSNYGMYKLPPSLEDNTLYYWDCNFYRITRNGNYVGCNATNIPANTPV